MADALLSALLDQLTSAIFKMAENEVRLVKGAGDAIDNLKKNLRAIKAVLKDAERRQWESDAVKLWIDDLKDVSYDMDDVLDEWGTAILRSEIDKEECRADQNASFARKFKVQLSALCRCFHSGPLTRVRHRRDIASKIENLNARLDSIAARKDMFNFSPTSDRVGELSIRSNTTTSFVDVSKVFGQDAHKKNLIGRLLSEDGENGGNQLQIVPIVGMGGIGKTTLAKIVYHDDVVKRHFGMRLWVCVSDPFDIVKIANAIIEQLTSDKVPSFVGLEPLIQKLIASIKDEKFLLVLDDVWTDEYQKWEQLEKPLLACGSSRVIVTTRKVEVARMMGLRESLTIRMEKLSKDDCWSLLSEIAFYGKRDEEREELVHIGMEIALKCNGLPLAAKTLGSLLRLKTTKEEWLDVLQSEIWRLEKVKENLFYPLLLSYFDLSPLEKRCFSYFAIFVKDQIISKVDLVYQWIAQGYLSSEKYEDGFTTGERCFDNLAMRSFFQDFEYLWEGHINGCKMHDIVHDFAQFLTLNEHSVVLLNDMKDKLELSTRHLTLGLLSDYEGQNPPLLSFSIRKNLHTLMFAVHVLVADKDLIDWCLHFAYLRLLSLESSKIEGIPKSIGDLVHLRYLHLRNVNDDNKLTKLPRTLGNLCNLQTLSLYGLGLPKEVTKLINLRHLVGSINDEDKIRLPKGINRLINLKRMDVKLCSSTSPNNIKEMFELGDLSNLNHLLHLRLWNVGIDEGHTKGATQAQLHKKAYLFLLALVFDNKDDETETSYEIHKSTLEALQPPPSLTILTISQYGSRDISPSWMWSSSISSAPNHLKFLSLQSCPNCETLPPLGKLQYLENLQIDDMKKVKKVGPEFLGIMPDMLEEQEQNENNTCSNNARLTVITSFPKLKRLVFASMPIWSEWVGIQGLNKECPNLKLMPCLQTLNITGCEELEVVPEFIIESTVLENIFHWQVTQTH